MAAERATTRRGEARRSALLGAAAQVLAEEGFGAVSHRSVAARAGLPLAATTYYFAGLDDLLVAATERLCEVHLAAATVTAATVPTAGVGADALADLVLRVLAGHLADAATPVDRLAGLYERYLQAGRRPVLRPVVKWWNARLVDLLADLLRRCGREVDAGQARLVLAVADGLVLAELMEGTRRPLAEARPALARALGDEPLTAPAGP